MAQTFLVSFPDADGNLVEHMIAADDECKSLMQIEFESALTVHNYYLGKSI